MKTKGYKQDIQNRLKPPKTKNNTETKQMSNTDHNKNIRVNTRGFDYNIRDSDRRPLLKSASTDVIISNHGPI